MNVTTLVSPPPNQRSYAPLIETLRNNDGWVAVDNASVAGATKATRQTAIHAACHRAGLSIETRTSQTHVYVRVLPLEVI
jgi:hypothetical protein